MQTDGRIVGECADKEDRMRSTLAIASALLLGACSVLGPFDFNGPSLDPRKVYLNATDVVMASPRETQRYACVASPLLCVRRGVGFECRCP